MASNGMIVDPYNEPAVTDCIEASGYQFRKNTLPTVAQYRIMCHNSACMEVAGRYLLSGKDLPSFNPHAKPILQGFVYPMIDFCYFHHVPTDPCPTDFLSQFFADMKALVDTCEKKSGFSFADLPPKVSYDGNNQKLLKVLCDVDECDNLMKRLHVKYFVETCQPFRVLDTTHNYFVLPPDFQAVWSKLVMPFVSECEVGRNDAPENPRWDIPYYFRGTEFTFIEMPGPLPGDPAPATTPPPTTPPPPATNTSLPPPPPATSSPPSPPSTSKPVPTLVTAPPTLAAGSPVVDISSTSSPTSEPSTTISVVTTDKLVQATTKSPTPSTLTRPLQSTSPVPVVVTVASEASSPSGSGSGVNGPNAVARGSKPPLAIPPAQTRTSQPRPTEAPVISDASNQTSNSSSYSLLWGVGIGVGATVLVLFVFLVILRRKRKVQKPGDGYQLFNGTETGSESAPPQHTDLVPCREIPVHQLSDIRIIGGGGFGIVYLVRYTGDKTTPDRNLLASKRINKENYSKDQLDAFIAEINLAATLSHPRIVEFVGVAGLRKAELQALFEYMAGGDLKRYLDSQPPTNPAHHSWTPEKLQIAIDIADALAYLHTRTPKPVVHRDLKSRNVMLTSDGRAKLGDFGVSRTESAAGSMTTGVGTSRWVAPEVILGGGDYTTACDVYSFGVVLSELDTHRLPFSDLMQANGEQLADFVLLPMVATERKQPSFSETCPPSILALSRSCLAYEATDRPTAVDVAEALRVVQREFGWVSPVKS